MSSPISSVSTNRSGLCPHGLPPAACPICNGGGMAGVAKMKEAPVTRPVKSGEWSYMKCLAVGMQMQAQENRVENAKQAFERQIEFSKQLGKNIQNIADRIQATVQNLQNSLPPALKIPLEIISNFIINPVLNLMSQIPKIVEKLAHLQKDVREFIQQAGEKLVSILGEVKNFVERKITENVKKKIKSLLSLFISELEDENYKNDDALAVFKARELRKHLLKILKLKKKRDDDVSRRFEGEAV